MTDTIKPALTPEEWAALPAPIKRPGADAADYVKIGDGFCVEGFREADADPSDPLADCDCGEVGFENARHALAALALHGQPFGFTREDVRLLLEATSFITRVCHGEEYALPPAGGAVLLPNLAARIESLLPPLDAPPPQPEAT